jgi:hypothetical protein
MDTGEQQPGRPAMASAQGTAPVPRQRPAGQVDPAVRPGPAAGRWRTVAAWTGGGLALATFFLRISLSRPANSDAANNALQAWDMLHGNYALHNWVLGDATYYTLDLPVYAVTEIFLGLHTITQHVAAALTYVIVVACAVAVAVTDSRGPARAARCGVVVAVMAAPLLVHANVSTLLGQPDHTGTSAILLVAFLLIDRFPGRRFTSPLLCAILCAGQIGDDTVRFVAVPAIVVVSVYSVLAGRKIRAADTAIAVAAVASVPLATAVRAAMLRMGAYSMIAPKTSLSPAAQWPHHAALALHHIRLLYGVIVAPGAVLGYVGTAFGLACLLAAAFGFLRVAWTWRTARRAEQLLGVAIVVNVAALILSTIPRLNNDYELVAVLPCGAILAARGLVPGRIAGRRAARVVAAVAGIAALLPLTAAATAPIASQAAPLAAWLEAHDLRYGIGWYWDASMLTVQSAGQVQVCAVTAVPQGIGVYTWETYLPWYDPSQHDARFVITPLPDQQGFTTAVYHHFGRPAATYREAGVLILVYRKNLLSQVLPALPLQAAISRGQAAGAPASWPAGHRSGAGLGPAMAWSGPR